MKINAAYLEESFFSVSAQIPYELSTYELQRAHEKYIITLI